MRPRTRPPGPPGVTAGARLPGRPHPEPAVPLRPLGGQAFTAAAIPRRTTRPSPQARVGPGAALAPTTRYTGIPVIPIGSAVGCPAGLVIRGVPSTVRAASLPMYPSTRTLSPGPPSIVSVWPGFLLLHGTAKLSPGPPPAPSGLQTASHGGIATAQHIQPHLSRLPGAPPQVSEVCPVARALQQAHDAAMRVGLIQAEGGRARAPDVAIPAAGHAGSGPGPGSLGSCSGRVSLHRGLIAAGQVRAGRGGLPSGHRGDCLAARVQTADHLRTRLNPLFVRAGVWTTRKENR